MCTQPSTHTKAHTPAHTHPQRGCLGTQLRPRPGAEPLSRGSSPTAHRLHQTALCFSPQSCLRFLICLSSSLSDSLHSLICRSCVQQGRLKVSLVSQLFLVRIGFPAALKTCSYTPQTNINQWPSSHRDTAELSGMKLKSSLSVDICNGGG